jgi:putative tryptophan/tyrosine transport system substrate-binding protein
MRFSNLRRREFITLLGGPASWPLTARAQQPAMPVVGFLRGTAAAGSEHVVTAFLQGLKEAGFVEGRNVAIEYRWADNKNDRLPALVADLIRHQVTVIVAAATPVAVAAKAATAAIPIVFEVSADPVQVGLVDSLNRPGGNLTGVTTLNVELGPKRLELLHEVVPTMRSIALLVNPASPLNAEHLSRDTQTAARTFGLELHVMHASTERDFDTVFASLVQMKARALVIGNDAFFLNRSEQLAALTVRHAVPAIFAYREFTAAGGLMSYGGSLTDAYRLTGVYTGRILKGEKPADLPVQQATKFELFINLKTAKTLGLTVPLIMQMTADEVIE